VDLVFIAIGIAFMLWGLAALFAAWFLPDLADHPLFRSILPHEKIESTRSARSLAASCPILLGLFLVLSNLPYPRPLLLLTGVVLAYLAISIAVRRKRVDG